MDINKFQQTALLSAAIQQKGIPALAHRSLGLAGEAGELANIVKKIIRDKDGQATSKDIEQIAEKLGDSLFYLAILADYFDLSLEEVASKVLIKSDNFRKSRNLDKS